MTVELCVYRMRIGLFVHLLGVTATIFVRNRSGSRGKMAVRRLAVAFLFVTTLLALCGDIETNPGPSLHRKGRQCNACNVYESTSVTCLGLDSLRFQ